MSTAERMTFRDLTIHAVNRAVVTLIATISPRKEPHFYRWAGWLISRGAERPARTRFGAEMMCDLTDYIPYRIFFFGVWEPAITRLIASVLRPGDLFVDVGANIGYDTLLGSHRVGPGGRVVAIEASARIFKRLRANVARNGADNVRLVQVAVSDRAGELTLYSEGDGNLGRTSSLMRGEAQPVERVPMLPLDEILDAEERRRVRLIKVDIEGGELPLLERLVETLDLYSPDMQLVVEMSDEVGPSLGAVFERLLAAGFDAYAIKNDYSIRSYLVPAKPADPVRIDRLPETQTDVHFRRAARWTTHHGSPC